ncbi:phosphate regulon sensor histidine kinase PhoR [Thioalkalivibrio sp. HK1]|uniref:phosphate regulon sensor histidine kinase PhoR n=1 Tax=Thioalkalivibrio sp. HK1 TaxID=1469245 RepID=UPI0004709FD8|nr:phosphate regulon sensor histidine kinase PhoR [Thioalkalivibrio sp. HK1]
MLPSRHSFEEWRPLLIGGLLLLVLDLVFGTLPWLIFSGTSVAFLRQILYVHRLDRLLRTQEGSSIRRDRRIWDRIFERLGQVRQVNRKRKKRLRKFVSRFEQASEVMPDAVVILDRGGIIHWMNQAADRLLGLAHPRDTGQPILHLLRHPSLTDYLEAREFDEPLEIESPLDDALRLSVRIVPYGLGQQLMLVRDISHIHRLEAIRKDFVANVSHELRSPLTVILGYLEAFEGDENLPPDLQKPMERMHLQAIRMRSIVEDLLSLSRLETVSGSAEYDEVDVAATIEMVVRDVRALGGQGHTLECEVEEGLSLKGNPGEIYSAISNIAFNAVRHTPALGTIRISWNADPLGQAALRISDTGEGIESHHLDRLTERFYRIDKARSSGTGGTGLGLAIVRHVLTRHDAHLIIESEPGVGSRFSCVFPKTRVVSGDEDLPGDTPLFEGSEDELPKPDPAHRCPGSPL